MGSRKEHLSLLAEIKTVRGLLENIPEGRVIEKISLERRLEKLTQEAVGIQLALLPRRLVVTYRGRPIVGTEGFFSDFASDATARLTDAVKAVVAGLSGNLKYSGPIPGAENTNLMITGVAKGSFGFEFEIPKTGNGDEGPLYDGLNPTEFAIDKIQHLLNVAVSNDASDESLADLVDEIHPRAVKKVKEFLDVLDERGALCAMAFNDHSFRFMDKEQLTVGRNKLDDSNIHETDSKFTGEIQGVLPKSRTFEFKVSGDETILRAKIGIEIEDPDILNREFLHHSSTITLRVVQVGQGRPRYMLRVLSDLSRLDG